MEQIRLSPSNTLPTDISWMGSVCIDPLNPLCIGK
jgi:hypothetical protein